MRTPNGTVCSVTESGGDHRVLHFVIENAIRHGARMPNLDAWVVDEGKCDKPYAMFLVLAPEDSSWPSLYFPCWSASEGVPIVELLAAALDQYAATHLDVERLSVATPPSIESQEGEAP